MIRSVWPLGCIKISQVILGLAINGFAILKGGARWASELLSLCLHLKP